LLSKAVFAGAEIALQFLAQHRASFQSRREAFHFLSTKTWRSNQAADRHEAQGAELPEGHRQVDLRVVDLQEADLPAVEQVVEDHQATAAAARADLQDADQKEEALEEARAVVLASPAVAREQPGQDPVDRDPEAPPQGAPDRVLVHLVAQVCEVHVRADKMTMHRHQDLADCA
jgi:hypothetical protein